MKLRGLEEKRKGGQHLGALFSAKNANSNSPPKLTYMPPLASIVGSFLSHFVLFVLVSCLMIRINDDKLTTQEE